MVRILEVKHQINQDSTQKLIDRQQTSQLLVTLMPHQREYLGLG